MIYLFIFLLSEGHKQNICTVHIWCGVDLFFAKQISKRTDTLIKYYSNLLWGPDHPVGVYSAITTSWIYIIPYL